MNELSEENNISKKIKELEKRIEKCEKVAQQYEMMYEQLEKKLRTLKDREGNIQAIYDYMTQIGSTLVRKKASSHTFLNPMNALEDKPKQIENDDE